MKRFWGRARAAFMARSRRERGLLLCAATVVVLAAGHLLVVDPALVRRAVLQRRIEQQHGDLQTLQAQLQTLKAQQQDPDAPRKAQLAALRTQLAGVDGEFARLQRSLVAPQEMGRLIEDLLQKHRGLQVLALRSLPVTPVNELLSDVRRPEGAASAAASVAAAPAPAASAPAGEAWLYRHGVQITVQGGYPEMQAWLAALERLPRRVYWGELKIDAQAWPASVMTVTLYTISLEKTWWTV